MRTSVQLYKTLADRQAQTRTTGKASCIMACLPELFKDTGNIFSRNSHAGIGDRKLHFSFLKRGANCDIASFGKTGGIVKQVKENLPYPDSIDPHLGQPGVNVDN